MKFKIGTWVHQKNSDYENIYTLIIGYTKKGKTECITIRDFRPVAAKKTLTGWYPKPVAINVLLIPVPLRRKVESKLKLA